MRNMSFAITTTQFLNQTKTVTRRMGWKKLNEGEVVRGVKKAMGLKKGEKIEELGKIGVRKKSFEKLNEITKDEVIKEGFPEMSPTEFIEMFCRTHKGCTPETTITRIEYEYVE